MVYYYKLRNLGSDGLNGSSNGGSSTLGKVVALGRGDSETGSLLLGVHKGDSIREGLLGSGDTLGVPLLHNLNLNTKDTLAEQDMTNGIIDEILAGLTGMDHEALDKLHGLGTLATELTRDDNLNSLGTTLHDKVEDTRAGTTDGQTAQQLVTDRLGLGDGTKATVLHLLGEELNGSLGETETLLDHSGELADAATILSKDVLGTGSTDDDLGALRGNTDLNTCIALLAQATSKELVQLGIENTISDKLHKRKEISIMLDTWGHGAKTGEKAKGSSILGRGCVWVRYDHVSCCASAQSN